jgi:hypothetical protein
MSGARDERGTGFITRGITMLHTPEKQQVPGLKAAAAWVGVAHRQTRTAKVMKEESIWVLNWVMTCCINLKELVIASKWSRREISAYTRRGISFSCPLIAEMLCIWRLGVSRAFSFAGFSRCALQ